MFDLPYGMEQEEGYPEKRSALLQSMVAVMGLSSFRVGPTSEPGCFCFCQRLHVCGVETPACLQAELFTGAPWETSVLSATVSGSRSAHVTVDI